MAIRFETPWEPTHPTAAAALGEMTRGRKIKVFGFGEYHSASGTQPALTTLHQFTRQLFPCLVKDYGVKHFGLELCYASESRPSTRALLSTATSLRTFRKMARALHHDYSFTVHGLFEPLQDVTQPTNYQDIAKIVERLVSQDLDPGTAVACLLMQPQVDVINDHAIRLVDRAIRQGAVLALYNGNGHIMVELSDEFDFSYVTKLPDVGVSLAEFLSIRLVVPEICLTWNDMPLPGDLEASRHAPLTGVHLSQISEQSYRLVFARSG